MNWTDWQWQFRNRLRTQVDLTQALKLERAEELALLNNDIFTTGITPYFVSLINNLNSNCPIRRQAVPTSAELEPSTFSLQDPLGEEHTSPVECIIHRYPDRAVLLVTDTCHMYCRHCTRRRLVGFREGVLKRDKIGEALDYIRAHPQIRDVLISGGDPLTVSDQRLEEIISAVRAIEHVEVIRIGTRAPVTNPFRITSDLVTMLTKYHPIWINVQFNHPNEITPESSLACERLANGGIPLGNQTVLLRGINDSVEVQRKLVQALVKIRVRPYYLYQCDLAEGIEHFRTPVARGLEIIEGLRGHTSGFAVPTFVIDAPGGGGKIPLTPQYLISQTPEKIILRNFEGKIIVYPEPQHTT